MNNKGEGKVPGWLWIVGIGIVLLLIANPGFFSNIFGNNASPTGGGSPIVTSATTLTFASVDALSPGTSLTGTSNIAVNGAAFKTGITSASGGDVLDVLLTNLTYHASVIKGYIVPTSKASVVIPAPMYKNASVTMTVFNTNNLAMTDGGNVNQTVVTGGSYNLAIRIDGQDKASTGDMRCILEASDGTKAQLVTLTGLGGATYVGMSKPSSYTLGGTSAQIWVYDVPAIVGAVSPTGTISITSQTSQTLSTTYLKVACRTKENFIDSNTGKLAYDIEDSLGTSKSGAQYSFTGYFHA